KLKQQSMEEARLAAEGSSKPTTDRLGQQEGESQPETNKTSSHMCPNCAHMNRPGIVFCENCGTNLLTGQQATGGTRDLREADSEHKDDSHTDLVRSLAPETSDAISSAGSAAFTANMTLR